MEEKELEESDASEIEEVDEDVSVSEIVNVPRGPYRPHSAPDLEGLSESEVYIAMQKFSDDYVEDLFNKNTDSFRCLAQALISRSSLLRHILYHFPELVDPGIDEAFDYIEPEVQFDSIGVQKYISICKDLKIGPIKRVVQSLGTDCMDLKYYGLSERQFKAICTSLLLNNHVKYLNLQDNWISPESAYWLSEMLRENNSIRVINLKECHLGVEGVKMCVEGFALNQSLQEIDFSHNELGDEGLLAVVEALKENQNIQKLCLRHNNFGEAGAEALAGWLRTPNNLDFLDVSWNNLYEGNALAKLCEGIMKSETLKILNLAWNGIGNPNTFVAFVKYLKTNSAIEHLDLSFNRLHGKMIQMLKAGLRENTSLKSINLGFNLISPDDALLLVSVFSPESSLEYMDLQNVFVNRRFLPIWKKLTAMGKSIRIEGVTNNYKIIGPDPMKLLFERCRYLAQKPKKTKAKRDFGTSFVWNLPETVVDIAGLKKLVRKSKIKLDKDLIEYLGEFFSPTKKRIDLKLMRDAYLEMYPNTEPPVLKKKPKKGKGVKRKLIKSPSLEETPSIGEFVEKAKIKQKLSKTLTSHDKHLSEEATSKLNVLIGSAIEQGASAILTIESKTSVISIGKGSLHDRKSLKSKSAVTFEKL